MLARNDLADRLRRAVVRIERPEAVVCVCGEFKKGKSSLVNAMLGVEVCPVDDDVATAVIATLGYSERPQVIIRRRGGDAATTGEPVRTNDLADYVTDRGSHRDGVERVEVRLPNPLLARGMAIVDTPGIGGVDPGHETAALGLAATTDAILFVTDASAELSEPEMQFVRQAHELCPTIIVAITKTDLFPAWRRIAAIDADRLAALGIPPPIPVSAHLRAAALVERNVNLNLESGLPALLSAVSERALEQRRDAAEAFARAEANDVVAQLAVALEAEASALSASGPRGATAGRLEQARSRLAHLRGPGARWVARLNDGFADLSSEVDHGFRADMRTLAREFDEELERIDPAKAWDETSGRLQARAVAVVQAAFERLMVGVDRIAAGVGEILAEDGLALAVGGDVSAPEVAGLWTGRPLKKTGIGASAARTFGALRGAQGGVLMLGLVGNLVGLTLAGPALVGAAAVFGAKQVVEDRRRQLTQRRQEARTVGRQFLEDVQFEVGARLRDLTRDVQQRLRNDISARLDERLRTYADAVRSLEAAAEADRATRESRAAEVNQMLAELRLLKAGAAA